LRSTLTLPGKYQPPSSSTITAILQRNGAIGQSEEPRQQAWKRFEHAASNDLWQMDFKGHFELGAGRCHPLTVLDDHSRFSLCLQACEDERATTVREHLTMTFRRYGLPQRITMDNGSPWGNDRVARHTPLTAWLLLLGIGVSHSRPYHPQTQGKDERFHRTLKAEVLQGRAFTDLEHCQRLFDDWRQVYNQQRPHEALGMAVPADRYQASPRAFPERLPAPEYGPGDQIRKVQQEGEISFRGQTFRIGRAFIGYPVGLRPTTTDGLFEVFFSRHCISHVDLRQAQQ
jgi:transposase InsO family protein